VASTLNEYCDTHADWKRYPDAHTDADARNTDAYTHTHGDSQHYADPDPHAGNAHADPHSAEPMALGYAAGITVTDAPANVTRIAAADANRHMLL